MQNCKIMRIKARKCGHPYHVYNANVYNGASTDSFEETSEIMLRYSDSSTLLFFQVVAIMLLLVVEYGSSLHRRNSRHE